ncbi:MAG: beta-lactamase family protein [Deltaproteobacteria bacterium]|nr:beta-lactamase family protein [Deltaproteobacteria bacterium]
MKQSMIVALILLLGSSASARLPDGAAGLDGASLLTDPAELEAFIDGAVAALLETHDVAGGTVAVVKDGELFFAKGYGLANAEEGSEVVASTSMFRIASISKLFAWTAVMQLWELGKLDLDEDVNTYLDFEIPASFPEPITLTHLLTHTAGFEDRYRGLFAYGIEGLGPIGEVLANNIPARVWPPGEVSAYSNFGAGLAGYIVERVSGLPFEQYVEEKIFAPLGMNYSTFRQPVPPELEADLAAGHSFYSGEHHVQDFEFDPAVADGAMSASAGDMARFMLAHLQLGRYGESRILEEATARKMHSRLFAPDPRILSVAHGFYEVNANGRRAIAHGGDLAYFHSDLVLLPEEDVGIFVSFNSESGGDARSEIVRVFLNRYFPEPKAARVDPPPDFADRASRFTGWYRMSRAPFESIEKVMFLGFDDATVSATGDNKLSISVMGEQTEIVEVEPLLFRPVGKKFLGEIAAIAFEEDDAGEIARMLPMPTFAFEKIQWYETVRFHQVLLGACLLVFVIRLVRAFTGRKNSPERTVLERWSHRAANALSILNLVFAAWFLVMIAQAMETYLFPDSVAVLLILPILSALLSAVLVVLAAASWAKGDGKVKNRVYASMFSGVSVAFVLFLGYWNLLGWNY